MSDKKKMSKKKKITILYAMLGVCIAAFLVFAGWLGYELYKDWQSQQYYTTLSAGIEIRPRSPGYSRSPDSTEPSAPGGEYAHLEPDFDPGWLPYLDFDALNERFPGVIGWIKLEGTAIDYPIMQTDNNWYFLGHLPDGTRHRSGSVFLDFRNSPDFSDKNSLLYGHESRTQDMFGALKNYRRQEYYDANPVMHIYTPTGDYELVLIAGYLVDSGVEQPRINFSDDDSFRNYINDIRRRSFFRADVDVSLGDRIVSLCTCAYDYTNARLIIVGKLVDF